MRAEQEPEAECLPALWPQRVHRISSGPVCTGRDRRGTGSYWGGFGGGIGIDMATSAWRGASSAAGVPSTAPDNRLPAHLANANTNNGHGPLALTSSRDDLAITATSMTGGQ
jgi:hypothetical protein